MQNPSPSLSVLLPVWDCQAAMVPIVAQLLEILPDLTSRFDVLLIDDGSRESTADAAYEQATLYPQVHVVKHSRRLGREAAMRTGLANTSGDLILFRDADCRVELDDLPKLWRKIHEYEVVVERVPGGALGSLPRLPAPPGHGWQGAEPGLQLIWRRTLEPWRRQDKQPSWLSYLASVGRPIHEVELRRVSRKPAVPLADSLRRIADQVGARSDRAAPSKVARPKFVDRLIAFALGE